MPRKTANVDPDMHLAVDASMRPRPDAAENAIESYEWAVAHGASMRPRPDAAENANQGASRVEHTALQ